METHFQARQTHNPKTTKQVYDQFIEKSTREGNLEKNTKFCSRISIFIIQASNKKVLLGMILEVGKILWSVWTSNIVDGLILVEPDILMANVFVQHALVHK